LPLPDPQPGLVIRYAYLWRSEAARGQEEGVKDRPCAVVLTAKREGDKTLVVVAPITHSAPQDSKAALEIPPSVKTRLGLDQARSWIMTNDVNIFTWPGPDLRPVNPQNISDGFVYGHLPRQLAQAAVDGVRQRMRAEPSMAVRRDEPSPEQKPKQRPKR
jgi:uncharacterized protein YifN (PemK superfamily)